jgi:hypothetical protein
MEFLKNEFKFLQDLFEINKDYNNFLSKFELYRDFKYKFLNDLNVTTTNIFEKSLIWKDLDINFHYQRQNLFIIQNDQFYNPFGFKRDRPESFYFTKNGQSANMIATAIVKDFLNLKIEKAHEYIYFETQPLLDFRNDSQNKCLLIDSSVLIKNEKILDFFKLEYDLFYLDASVLDNNDQELRKVLDFVKNNKIPFILTKSHLKLDFCGGEYSQLGSISILNLEDELNNLRLNTRSWSSDIPFFGKLLYEMISLYGVMADLESIFPFLNHIDYKEHILKRNELIKSNSYTLVDELKKDLDERWSFREYSHGQFFMLITDIKSDFPKKKLRNYIRHQQSCNDEYPIYFCDSFGFDFLSISIIGIGEGKLAFRICPGIISVDKTLKELKIVINTIRKLIEVSSQ